MTSLETLVQNLYSQGVIQTDRVVQVMKRVDRGKYVPAGLGAYEDRPQPIGDEQTISAPHMHGQALELLNPFLRPGHRALDVGCGSGYLTACMGELVSPGGWVIGIENRESLVDVAIANITRANPALLNSTLKITRGDGWTGEGFQDLTFDAIHVGAAAESVPEILLRQLKSPGRMVIPVGPQWGTQTFLLIDKDKSGAVTQKELMAVMYVPLERQGLGSPRSWAFRGM